jgi:hypothetical protein
MDMRENLNTLYFKMKYYESDEARTELETLEDDNFGSDKGEAIRTVLLAIGALQKHMDVLELTEIRLASYALLKSFVPERYLKTILNDLLTAERDEYDFNDVGNLSHQC